MKIFALVVVLAAAALVFVYARLLRSRAEEPSLAQRTGDAFGRRAPRAGASAEGPPALPPKRPVPSASAAPAGPAEKRAIAESPYAGVEFRAGNPACRAARALSGMVFLVSEAPVLPLARCDAPRCRCAFEKRPDRREESRRWEDIGVQPTITSAVNRRSGMDRRKSGKPKD